MSQESESKKVPENATRDNQGMRILLDALSGGTGGVEREEAAAQGKLAASDVLPTKMPPEARAALEAAGVRFCGPVPGDNLFQYAELPAGWRKELQAGNSYYTNLLDEAGLVRAVIFYKAVFYDRRADLYLAR